MAIWPGGGGVLPYITYMGIIWDVSVQCLLELAKLQINIGNAKKTVC